MTDKALQRQNIKNVYEPEIKAMRKRRTALVGKIEKLKIQKIFMDNNVKIMNEKGIEYGTMLPTKKAEFEDITSLKGNYMKYVDSETESILGYLEDIDMNNSYSEAEKIQSDLDKKIEDLQSDLSGVMRDISDTIFSFQQALNSIV